MMAYLIASWFLSNGREELFVDSFPQGVLVLAEINYNA